ncbi:hypothetical protein CCMA1212_005618 [Trichoderma ghanense]|uniref:Uncharacterized protein n=1 Tax=Trichoderma ghanense TaxID=65468 RepID=A0ABY2H246_9HYPO
MGKMGKNGAQIQLCTFVHQAHQGAADLHRLERFHPSQRCTRWNMQAGVVVQYFGVLGGT